MEHPDGGLPMADKRAREILKIVADVILEAGDKLDDSFERVVQMILECEGRVIL